MATRSQIDRTKDYIERWGVLFELLGGTRVMGRIVGWLLVCDPPEQTAAQIAEAVGASAGSVSTATRRMVEAAFIERVGVPGARSAHFRMRPGTWGQLLRRRLAHLNSMLELAEEGLGLVRGDGGDADAEKSLRLREIMSYCRFVDRELPDFLSRWEKEWEKERSDGTDQP